MRHHLHPELQQLCFDFGRDGDSAKRTEPHKLPPRRQSSAVIERDAVASETVNRNEAHSSTPEDAAFVTEAQAGFIFLGAVRELGRANIRAVRVCFKAFRSTLYSYKVSGEGVVDVKFHIAFRSATPRVIEQAARIILGRTRRQSTAQRRDYDAFVRAIPQTQFELPEARRGRRLSFSGPGKHHSLEESFKRVNDTYFKSQLEQPELCWSPARARRILGSYQERKDRLIVSQVFDSPNIPLYVLDYLMYHELLHKFLGIGRRSDGKRCMHGRDFRNLERRFRHFHEAQRFLKKL